MGVLKKIKTSFADLKLRTKLFISFTVIIIVPVLLVGLLYFHNSSGVISKLASKNVFEIVKKNNQIIDTRLSKIGESSLSVLNDYDLFKAFSAAKNIDQMNILEMDRQVSKVLTKYFSSSPDIGSVYWPQAIIPLEIP